MCVEIEACRPVRRVRRRSLMRRRGRRTGDDLVVHPLLKALAARRLGRVLPGRGAHRVRQAHRRRRLPAEQAELGQPEAVLLVDRAPDARGGRAGVACEALGIEREVDVFALGQVVEEAEVRVAVVTAWEGNALVEWCERGGGREGRGWADLVW